MNEIKRGVVQRFGARGFGFLIELGTRRTYFVHINDVIGRLALQAGDQVEFQVGPDIPGKTTNAIQVRLIKQPERLDRSLCELVLSTPPDSIRVIRPAVTAQPNAPATGGGQ